MGNGTTLFNSNSVWQKIVKDTWDRGCFFNGTDEKELLNAIFKPAVEYPHADNLAKHEPQRQTVSDLSVTDPIQQLASQFFPGMDLPPKFSITLNVDYTTKKGSSSSTLLYSSPSLQLTATAGTNSEPASQHASATEVVELPETEDGRWVDRKTARTLISIDNDPRLALDFLAVAITQDQAAPPTPVKSKKCGRKAKALAPVTGGSKCSIRLDEQEQASPPTWVQSKKKHCRKVKALAPVTAGGSECSIRLNEQEQASTTRVQSKKKRHRKVKVLAPVTTGGSKCTIRLNEIVTDQQATPTPEQAKKRGRKTKPLQVITEGLRRSSRLNEKGKHQQVAPPQEQAKKHGRKARTLAPVTTEDLRRSSRLNEKGTHQQVAASIPEQTKKCGRKAKRLPPVTIEGLRRSNRLSENNCEELADVNGKPF